MIKLFIIFIFVVTTASLAAIALALIKIDSEEIFRYAEQKKNGMGVFIFLTCWIILLPIMILLSLFVGLYKYIIVKFPKHQSHKPGSY
jgi:hypothetical protein